MKKMKKLLSFGMCIALTLSMVIGNSVIVKADSDNGNGNGNGNDNGNGNNIGQVKVHINTDYSELSSIKVEMTVNNNSPVTIICNDLQGTHVDGTYDKTNITDTTKNNVTAITIYWKHSNPTVIPFGQWRQDAMGNGTLNIWLADMAAPVTPSASPEATATPSASPEATAAPSASPEATAAPSASPEATAAPSASPEATAAPSASPEATAAPSASPEATAAPSASPEASVAPSASPEASVAPSASPQPTTAPTAAPVIEVPVFVVPQAPVSTVAPTAAPTATPTVEPTTAPTETPVIMVDENTTPQAGVNNDNAEVTISDNKAPAAGAKLPQTGTADAAMFYGIGIVSIVAGFAILRSRKTKRV